MSECIDSTLFVNNIINELVNYPVECIIYCDCMSVIESLRVLNVNRTVTEKRLLVELAYIKEAIQDHSIRIVHI